MTPFRRCRENLLSLQRVRAVVQGAEALSLEALSEIRFVIESITDCFHGCYAKTG